MFRRDRGTKAKIADGAATVKESVADAADALAEYIDPLAKDEKLRERLAAAIVAGAAARDRVRKQTGVTGLARRLAADPVLRAQLVEMATALEGAQRRARKARSHRLRNRVLFVTGIAMTAAAVPAVREKATSIMSKPGSATVATSADEPNDGDVLSQPS